MIIHLNGRPGVGKKTIAKSLAEMFNARMIDNHQVLNLALSLADRGTTLYDQACVKLFQAVLEEMKVGMRAGHTYILINALTNEIKKHKKTYDQIYNAAIDSHFDFIPVLLTCDFNENAKRLETPSRLSQNKLTDVALLQEMYQDFSMINDAHDHTIELDVTHLSAKEAAKKIYTIINYRQSLKP